MATLRRRQIGRGGQEKRRSEEVASSEESNISEDDDGEACRSPVYTQQLSDDACVGSSKESHAAFTLDVLAQVASATLQKEPTLQSKLSPIKKVTRRSIKKLDIVNFEQIQDLSISVLIDAFTEHTADEITRNFTFRCALLPSRCEKRFTSFGNENKARHNIKEHLTQHMKDLMDSSKKNSAEMADMQFVTIYAQRQANSAVSKRGRRGFKRTSTTEQVPLSPPKGRTSQFTQEEPYTKIKKYKENKHSERIPKGQLINLGNVITRSRKENALLSENVRCYGNNGSPSKNPTGGTLIAMKVVNKDAIVLGDRASRNDVSKQSVTSDTEDVPVSFEDETKRRIAENEQFIIDLLSRNQPHHDHCYTTIFGKKDGIETMHLKKDLSENNENDLTENDDNTSIDVGDSSSYYEVVMKNKLSLQRFRNRHRRITNTSSVRPIQYTEFFSGMDNLQMLSHEEVYGDQFQDDDEDNDDMGHDGQRPYPPMPKCPLAKKGRLPVLEEMLSPSDNEIENEEIDVDVTDVAETNEPQVALQKDAPMEWERKLALRCIRELKGRKKDDPVPLICKICRDKTFTATATLMYHYRSHAGIKPFVCLICNTTFTRQHSLNYHMLIHNNQSRFTCKDCGRKFRHPSHFKEHLRRHTGETPFECDDCPLKFKTRNSYKRHLKTRHGMLLTASGIVKMSLEDAMKARTKPYNQKCKKDGSGENDDDTDDEDEDDEDDAGDAAVPVAQASAAPEERSFLVIYGNPVSEPIVLHGSVSDSQEDEGVDQYGTTNEQINISIHQNMLFEQPQQSPINESMPEAISSALEQIISVHS